jgi:hypothetical protein
MLFPNLPHTLNRKKPSEDGDPFLLKLLKDKGNFSYLSDETRNRLKELKLTVNQNDFRFLHKDFIELWPRILTDAVLQLIRSSKDYNEDNPRMDSFFDAATLGARELGEVLKGFSEFEGIMYGASPGHYRDHVAHSFRVWIIGQWVLKKCFKRKLSGLGDFDEKIKEEEWESMWALVALCHDIGYPLSKIEHINERARQTLRKQGLISEGDMRFTFRRQMLPFHDTIVRLMASNAVALPQEGQYTTHLQNKYYLKFLKSFDRLDHGIVSSFLMSKALVYFLESDLSHDTRKPLDSEDARQFLIRREILRAVASHTCPEIYHLQFNTLPFLLYIVDEVQCWGRPTLEELQHEAVNIKEASASLKKFSATEVDIEIKTKDKKKWTEDQQAHVLNQVLKLRTMLRLAPKRKDYLNNNLSFEVGNEQGNILRLALKKQAMQIEVKGFAKKVLDEVPLLKGQTKRIINS